MAIFDPVLGWTPDGQRLDSQVDWARFFQEDLPDAFVIKPNWGTHGRSVQLITRSGGSFADHNGESLFAADMVHRLATHQDFDRFVIQERLEPHPDLIALTGSPALHTLRVVTGIDNSGQVLILFAVQKLAAGGQQFDNFAAGAAGNHVAELELEGGRIVKGLARSDSGFDFTELVTHPTTGRPLVGFQVPHWQQVRDLATDTARKFLPIRTAGWDIAVTTDGPVLFDGNFFWGTALHSALRNVSPFLHYANEMIGAAGKGRLPDRNSGRVW